MPIYYAGGDKISRFRGEEKPSVFGPEDWVGSLTSLPANLIPNGSPSTLGISPTSVGLLDEVISRDPTSWFGTDHLLLSGENSGLLVKLLDAGERLPVHYHPSREFAHANLNSVYGKTEGWVILEAEPNSSIWLGFKEQLQRSQVLNLIEDQDGDAMLNHLNEVSVSQGDVLLVPAGCPHSIGPGVLIAEIQEPTSFSFLLEYEKFEVESLSASLNLGWERALDALDMSGYGTDLKQFQPVRSIVSQSPSGTVSDLFGSANSQYFRVFLLDSLGNIEFQLKTFCIAMVISGKGELQTLNTNTRVKSGDTLAIPFGQTPFAVKGICRLLLFIPPVEVQSR
jgi:mannose-6-phosphate isomerase